MIAPYTRLFGNHHLISEHRALLAQKLSELAPGTMPYTVFGVGGGEAIDLAIKGARGFTRRAKIISAVGGYQGHTGLALLRIDWLILWYVMMMMAVPTIGFFTMSVIVAMVGAGLSMVVHPPQLQEETAESPIKAVAAD